MLTTWKQDSVPVLSTTVSLGLGTWQEIQRLSDLLQHLWMLPVPVGQHHIQPAVRKKQNKTKQIQEASNNFMRHQKKHQNVEEAEIKDSEKETSCLRRNRTKIPFILHAGTNSSSRKILLMLRVETLCYSGSSNCQKKSVQVVDINGNPSFWRAWEQLSSLAYAVTCDTLKSCVVNHNVLYRDKLVFLS